MNKVRSLLMLVERLIEEGQYDESRQMVEKVEGIRRVMLATMGRGNNSNMNINKISNDNNINNFNIITTTTTASPLQSAFPPSLLI